MDMNEECGRLAIKGIPLIGGSMKNAQRGERDEEINGVIGIDRGIERSGRKHTALLLQT